jgi:hypothetical protein
MFALAVLASTAWTPVAVAKEFPKVIPLSSLDGTVGLRLDGAAAGNRSGFSVAGAGDFEIAFLNFTDLSTLTAIGFVR